MLLKDICDITSGQNAPQLDSDYVAGGKTFIKVSDLDTIIFDLSENRACKISEEAICRNRLKLFPKGSIIFAKSGLSCVKNRVYVIQNDAYIVNHLCVLYNIRPEFDSKWLSYYIKSFDVTKLIKDFSYPSIKLSDIGNIIVPDIDLTKQKRIVQEIENIEKQIKASKEKLESFEEIVKSRFIEMFGTIDMSEERDEWEPLENLCKIYTGTTPSSTDESNWNGDILWITPAEMNSDSFYIFDTVRKITEKGRKSKSLDIMPVNTVLLSTRAPIGKVGIVGNPMACNQGFKNFECKERLNPVFLFVLLKNNTEYLNSLGSGTTFLEVSKSKIAKTKVPVPLMELQNEFELFVKQIDKLKLVAKAELFDLEELLNIKMGECCERE